MATETSTPVTDSEIAPAEASPHAYPISVELYQRIVGSGVFGDKPAFHLCKGRLVGRSSDGAQPRPYVMPIDLYERLVEEGVFDAHDPVYLWKGRLVEKMPKGPRHIYAQTALYMLLIRLVPEGWHVRHESPVRVVAVGVPEPDFMVLRGANRDHKNQTPTSLDVALAVEVADSSVNFDSGEKLEVYAAAAIPVNWVVNLPGGSIDVYTRPVGATQMERARYLDVRPYRLDDEVPVTLDGREVGKIAVRDVLP